MGLRRMARVIDVQHIVAKNKLATEKLLSMRKIPSE